MKMNRAEHKKVAESLYKRLEIAVAALEKAQATGNQTTEEKAELRIKALEDKLAALKAPGDKEDKDVCSECGGNLSFVEEGVVYCPACKQYYEFTEEEE
jgi:uncharacterized protein YbaR (Trm112 family)